MITAANILNGRIQYQTTRKTSQKAFDYLLTDKSRPQIGDLLFTKDGTLGRIGIVDQENVCINQSVAVVRFKAGEDVNFYKYLLESPFYQKIILDNAGGSAIKHIYITIIDKMKIAVPKLKLEKSSIRIRLSSISELLSRGNASLESLKSLKQGLMQDLLTGKREVKV
jgi:type I restriction enzyme S subunit